MANGERIRYPFGQDPNYARKLDRFPHGQDPSTLRPYVGVTEERRGAVLPIIAGASGQIVTYEPNQAGESRNFRKIR